MAIQSNWQLAELTSTTGRRSAGAAAADPFLGRLAGTKLKVAHTFSATSPQRRSAEAIAPLDLEIPAEPGAAYVLALRHPSGAISFHAPQATSGGRRSVKAARTVSFHVDLPDAPEEAERRGIIAKVVSGTVLKVAGKIADVVVPFVAGKIEAAVWKKKGLAQGWLAVTNQGVRSGKLAPADFSVIQKPSDRCLLLLHGTFSDAASAFAGLASTPSSARRDFLAEVAGLYGPRMFAFNHFSVSKTPEENARELVASLPKAATFDVITHSRGGLVLRNLVERASVLGPNAQRFTLGHAALVAAPNQGTPLASPGRWDEIFGWLTNLLELFPDNPFTTGAEFIAEALTWIANHVVGSLPGLESMDVSGSMIRTLNAAPSPAGTAYSALVSNYEPKGKVLARMADLGIDGIFARANDLVVPTEGGWRVDAPQALIPGTRIGCFGRNGNITANDVNHVTFFGQTATIDFLINALNGKPQGLPPLDPATNLPFGIRRGGAPGDIEAARTEATVGRRAAEPVATLPKEEFRLAEHVDADEVLHLFLISMDNHLSEEEVSKMEHRPAILLATFRNARVVETIYIRGKKEGDYGWDEIIGYNERIKGYIEGKPNLTLPVDAELREFGGKLFAALFTRSIRRLYDNARVESSRSGRRLDIVITSMINWVADKPWEFVYDPHRQTFLAAEDVNFTRNVLTSVPADVIECHSQPMRILVVVAQPINLGLLSTEEEEQVVRRGFQHLEEEGLARVEVLLHCQIETLHKRLRLGGVDIIHFIGHGEFDSDTDQGYLIFENPQGGDQRVSSESLRQILCHRGIRLIFLNACETGMAGRGGTPLDFNRGVAPKLVGGGIPVVVANQYKVLDVSATEFAQHFYWWLARGSNVGDAAREARVAVNYTISGECIDWAVPVVFARNPGRPLFLAGEVNRLAADLRAKPAVRIAKGVRTVGLWDVNHMVPGLEAFAENLNQRQSVFHFRPVSISAPVGTWRPARDAAGGAFIRGDEVAARLNDQISALGLDHIFCLTSFTVEEEALTLWNTLEDRRFAIISGAGLLEEMQGSEYPLNRFLVNTLAAALNSTKDGHTMPPTSCPNHYQEGKHASLAVRLSYLTGRQTFCAACRKQMTKEETEALDQILDAY